jgi:hypothetical protein
MKVHEVKVAGYVPMKKVRDENNREMEERVGEFKPTGVRLEFADRHPALKQDQLVEENGKLVRAHGTTVSWFEQGDKDTKGFPRGSYTVRTPSCPVRDPLDPTLFKENKHTQVITTSSKTPSMSESEFSRIYEHLKPYMPLMVDCWIEHEAKQAEKMAKRAAKRKARAA